MYRIYLNDAFSIDRKYKKILLVVLDAVVFPILLWLSYSIRLLDFDTPVMQGFKYWPFLIALIGVASLSILRIYRAVIRSFNESLIIRLALATLLAMVCIYCFAGARIAHVPMSIPIIFGFLMFIWVWTSRGLIRILVKHVLSSNHLRTRIAIYGAGDAGRQLAVALAYSKEHMPICFIDDDTELHGQWVEGLRVYSVDQIEAINQRYKIDEIFLAMPSISRQRKLQILKQVESVFAKIKEVPALDAMVGNQIKLSDVKEIDIIDLLGREPVPPILELLSKNITGKVVMVTGAGGSIGSELCRQIIKQLPEVLVLYDVSEFSLYSIDNELQQSLHHVKIVSILGSVLNQNKLIHVMQQYKVVTVYHAAAYKHVPLVEANPIEGLCNNSVGTAKSIDAAIKAQVETFVLISTDKAVRPTNVMGASKRLAELYCQAKAVQNHKTKISIVRFGNVLGSSGSVVPLFKRQIEQGGPITVTHPEVTRYFMTIPEAALLVIQAGAMGEGGDVFLLDMGESVKIVDLAMQMIHLSGLKLHDNIQDGDIEIHYTGLRPGEKLYEELLIDQSIVQKTQHERIVKSFEKQFDLNEIKDLLNLIDQNYTSYDDFYEILDKLEFFVDGYYRSPEVTKLWH